jgi:preprotein translocase subunit Sss1
LPFSAVDAISPAFEHTKRQLFQPFRIGQWVRLALVGLLAGELGSGGFKIPNLSNFNLPRHPGSEHFLTSDLAGSAPMLFAGLIAVLVVAALLLGILLTYVSSVMRFILFDSVLVKDCHIREGWSRRQGPGWHYFLWKLLYLLSTFGVLIVLVGIPAGFAFAVGWLNNPKQHMVVLVLGGIVLFLAIMIFLFVMAVIYVLTKDFVVPQMALENIGALEGWRRLWAMMKAEKSSYAGYIGMKIVLAIVVGIILGIVGFIIGLIILIPAAGVAVAAVLGGKAAGLGWTAATITLAVVAGSLLLAVFLFVMALISVPVIVFFPAYSIYFFAARYPALSSALHPAPPASPPYNPPPLPVAPTG